MLTSSRFQTPSLELSPRRLLRRTQSVLWVGFGLALGVHAAFTQWRGTSEEPRPAKPLTMQFVKRRPRLTKPLELKKRPKPKARQLQRKMVAVTAKLQRGQATGRFRPALLVPSLVRPRAGVLRSARLYSTALEPRAMAEAIGSAKEAASHVDMGLEMVDIDALDTGQYHAMVIQDSRDKRSIRGFFHFYEAESASMILGDVKNWNTARSRAVIRLIGTLNRYTDIKADVRGKILFANQELLLTPWVFSSSRFPFKLPEPEARNLGLYLTCGGFIFIDCSWRHGVLIDKPQRAMLNDALASHGIEQEKDWAFEPIPNDHPVYHCYFDFDGPPVGKDWRAEFDSPLTYLEGIVLENRLVCIFSGKGYIGPWGEWGPDGVIANQRQGEGEMDPTRQLQFGVNTIVFALTQEGSITQRLMESVQ